MTNFLTVIKLVLSLLPLLIDVTKAVEAALPQAGLGSQKLALVRTTLQAAFEITGDAVASFEQVWPALEKTVGAIVGVFNAAGIFKKS